MPGKATTWISATAPSPTSASTRASAPFGSRRSEQRSCAACKGRALFLTCGMRGSYEPCDLVHAVDLLFWFIVVYAV